MPKHAKQRKFSARQQRKQEREQERKLRKLSLWLGILGGAAGLFGRVWDLFHRQ